MKKIFSFLVVTTMSLALFAVPAKRGYHDFPSAEGGTVSLTQMGDEFSHWYQSADGTIYSQDENGRFAPSAITHAELDNRRKASLKFRKTQARYTQTEIGNTPNLAPKGVVILVNFKDTKMNTSHTYDTFNELFNSENCTVNNGFPSASEYFKSQSNGAYHPVFDVFGPVTLSKNFSYYGKNDSEGNDEYATDAVIEACILANSEYADLNFANYDSDNDGYVDFIYVVYAGKGEADGGSANTIWPHNYSIQDIIRYPAYTEYSKSDTKIDGKYLDNYAMSSELEGSGSLCGIGTLCHEFGHVMGMPDFYDTTYGNNYKNAVTPNDWDIMDGGSYNEDGHCPPNYSPWEKYFFGWHTPINLGNEGTNLELIANGKEGYQAYQINTSGNLIGATTSGECYYIENRQQQGWDKGLPSHGMLIWKVNFNQSAWENNTPNNTANNPKYTIVSASGTKIGTHINSSETAYEYDGPKNPYPGSAKVTTKTIAGKPLLNIAEKNGLITLTYIEEPVEPVDPFDITWKVNGTDFATTTSTGKVVLPEEEPEACDGYVFMGWCATEDYNNATTAPTFVKAGEAASEGAVFYAVFAKQSGEGGAVVNDVLDRLSTSATGSTYQTWTATGTSQAVYKGNSAGGNESIQLRSNNSNSGIVTTTSAGKIRKVSVSWNQSTTDGRTLDVYGKNSAYSSAEDLYNSSKQGTKLGSIVYGTSTELIISGDYTYVGVRSKQSALYLSSITFSWGSAPSFSDYTTQCSVITAIETTTEKPVAVKAIRNGQVVILRGNEVYNLLGVKQ